MHRYNERLSYSAFYETVMAQSSGMHQTVLREGVQDTMDLHWSTGANLDAFPHGVYQKMLTKQAVVATNKLKQTQFGSASFKHNKHGHSNQYCFKYNAQKFCVGPPACNYAHLCLNCSGKHPRNLCRVSQQKK